MELPTELVILDETTARFELKYITDIIYETNVFITNAITVPGFFLGPNGGLNYRIPFNNEDGIPLTLAGAVVEAAARSWGVAAKELAPLGGVGRNTEVLVGTASTGQIRTEAYVIRRPEA